MATPDSMELSVALADSQNGRESGLPADIIARRRSGSATSATPDGTASSARATSLRVMALAGRAAWAQRKSISTPVTYAVPPSRVSLPPCLAGAREVAIEECRVGGGLG
ncbi:hypothetical protein GCM10020216_054770 [Nonomuraea helvata]